MHTKHNRNDNNNHDCCFISLPHFVISNGGRDGECAQQSGKVYCILLQSYANRMTQSVQTYCVERRYINIIMVRCGECRKWAVIPWKRSHWHRDSKKMCWECSSSNCTHHPIAFLFSVLFTVNRLPLCWLKEKIVANVSSRSTTLDWIGELSKVAFSEPNRIRCWSSSANGSRAIFTGKHFDWLNKLGISCWRFTRSEQYVFIWTKVFDDKCIKLWLAPNRSTLPLCVHRRKIKVGKEEENHLLRLVQAECKDSSLAIIALAMHFQFSERSSFRVRIGARSGTVRNSACGETVSPIRNESTTLCYRSLRWSSLTSVCSERVWSCLIPFEWAKAISDETHLAWSRFNLANIQQLILMPMGSYTKLNAYQINLWLNRWCFEFFGVAETLRFHFHYLQNARNFAENCEIGCLRNEPVWLLSARFFLMPEN